MAEPAPVRAMVRMRLVLMWVSPVLGWGCAVLMDKESPGALGASLRDSWRLLRCSAEIVFDFEKLCPAEDLRNQSHLSPSGITALSPSRMRLRRRGVALVSVGDHPRDHLSHRFRRDVVGKDA